MWFEVAEIILDCYVAHMKASVSFDEIVEAGKPQIKELNRLEGELVKGQAPDEESRAAFFKQANVVESVLKQTYGVAALVTRRTEDLKEIAEIWESMSQLCDLTVNGLRELKQRNPRCGAPQLYDLALDYKLACDNRLKNALEELECQKTDLPEGLSLGLN